MEPLSLSHLIPHRVVLITILFSRKKPKNSKSQLLSLFHPFVITWNFFKPLLTRHCSATCSRYKFLESILGQFLSFVRIFFGITYMTFSDIMSPTYKWLFPKTGRSPSSDRSFKCLSVLTKSSIYIWVLFSNTPHNFLQLLGGIITILSQVSLKVLRITFITHVGV
jgi:hypothetical protein